MTQSVGMIGLGVMGGAIATRLLGNGVRLTVFDIDPAAVAKVVDAGAVAAQQPADLADCDVVLTSLPNDDVVTRVLLDDGLLARLGGKVVVELSTILPDTMRAIGRRGAASSVAVLDSPVSGGPGEALAGKLVLMVGAADAELARVRPMLELLGTVERVGTVGDGKAIKLVNNVMSMCNVAIAAEAFTLGSSFGLDPQRLYQVLSTSGGRSGQFIKRIPYVLERDFHARFAITLAEKDLRLAIDMAHGLTFPMPVAAGIHQLYEQAIATGLGGEDQMALIKLYESWAAAQSE